MRSAESPRRRSSTIIGRMTPSPSFPAACAARASSSAALCVALLLGSGLALRPAAAVAQDEPSGHRHALGAKLGTTGLGLEYSYAHATYPKYGLRANVNFGTYSRTETWNGIEVEGSIKFSSLMLLADAHPFANGFRASAGLMVNNNKVEGSGRPVAPTFSINGTTYPASALDRLDGELRFQYPSPYFGVGWGAAPTGTPGLFFSVDFGVMYQRASVTLDPRCGATLAAADCARLQSDARAQAAKFRADAVGYRMFPVLTFGGGYKF
jgi:hypothetical protein